MLPYLNWTNKVLKASYCGKSIVIVIGILLVVIVHGRTLLIVKFFPSNLAETDSQRTLQLVLNSSSTLSIHDDRFGSGFCYV